MKEYVEKLMKSKKFIDKLTDAVRFTGMVALINIALFRLYPILLSLFTIGTIRITPDNKIPLSKDGVSGMFIGISRLPWLNMLTFILFAFTIIGYIFIMVSKEYNNNNDDDE